MNFIDKLAEEVLSKEQFRKRQLVENISLDRIDEALLQDFVREIQRAVKATKVFFKKVAGKVITFFQRGKETGVVLPKTKQVVMKWAGRSVYINPKLVAGGKVESTFNKIVTEVRGEAEIAKAASKGIQKVGGKMGDIAPDEKALSDIEDARVTFDDLMTILNQLAFQVKIRTKYTQKCPALLIMGPPGTGKTTIIDYFGQQKNWNVKKLEISSIYKEIIGGFPIITKVLSPSKGASKLSPEEQKKLSKEQESAAVKIVQSDLLPPSKDPGNWILFMDEFNRDSEKMGAVMNLCLTGNIGNQYHLPLKTLVVASGNIGGDTDDGDDVPVAEMDSATWDRFDRKVLLTYDWISRAEYGETEDEMMGDYNMGGDPSVIANFIYRTTKEQGTDKWKVPLSQFNPDAKATLTPRTLSILSRNMKVAALRDWEEDELVGNKDKSWYEKNYKKADFPSAPAYYLHVNQINKRYLGDIARTTLGSAPADVITDMFAHFQKTKEEVSNVSVEDVLTNWTNLRGDKPKPEPKLANEFTLMIPDLLNKFKTKAAFEKFLDKQEVKMSEDVAGDVAVWAAVNIHNFIKDSKLKMDVAGSIAKNLAEYSSLGPQAEGEEEGEKKKPKIQNEFLDEVLSFLIKNSDVFSKAWMEVSEAAQDEAKDKNPEALKQALALAEKGRLVTGAPPKYVSANLSGQDLKNYLIIRNLQALIPAMNLKKLKIEKAKREESKNHLEKALKKLFEKMGE